MIPTRYAYVCVECGHCKLLKVRREGVNILCPLCCAERTFLLYSIVTDHGDYEEWKRI